MAQKSSSKPATTILIPQNVLLSQPKQAAESLALPLLTRKIIWVRNSLACRPHRRLKPHGYHMSWSQKPAPSPLAPILWKLRAW